MIATRSARYSASSMKWVVRKTVLPEAGEVPDHLPGVAPGVRVEARRRLVEEQQLPVADQREREVEPPLLATGQRLDRPGRFSVRSTRSSTSSRWRGVGK